MVTKLVGNEEGGRSSGESTLYSSVSGVEDAPAVVLLHGLFGMGSNLGALARALRSEYRVHQVDLPSHGRSPWVSRMTLADLAEAVANYMEASALGPAHVLGHSLGGKVAMQLALSRPELLASLTVADIAPVEYSGSHDDVFEAIDVVIEHRPTTRRQAAKLMREHIAEEGVVQFLALSLRRDDDGGYVWRFNARALLANYGEFRQPPIGKVYPGPALFVSGALSNYVTQEGVAAAQRLFPAAQFAVLAGAGHWLHVEQPDEFNAMVTRFFTSIDADNRIYL